MARGVSRKKKAGKASPARRKTAPKPKKPAPKKPKGSPISSKRADRIIIHPDTGEEMVLKQYDQYPEAVRYVAKIMYISGQAKPSEIAKKFQIPIGTIRSWQSRDKWTFLKRQVTRLANKDAVKAARQAMSKYVTDIDRGLNENLSILDDRLNAVTDEHKMKDEYTIIRTILQVWQMKINLFRALTYGVHGKSFYPHPSTLRFDGTEADPTAVFGATELDKVLGAVPDYMKEAAKYVIGMGPDDIDEDVYDAVAIFLDKSEKEKKDAKVHRKKALAAEERKVRDAELEELDIEAVDELLDSEEED